MTEIHTEIISGKELLQKDLDIINKYRKIRLNRSSIWDHTNNSGFEERTFFLVKNSFDKLLSFGTLREIKIFINKKQYSIWGIQAVISIEQGKGYGKILLTSIQKFVKDSGITMVGFCEKYNTDFYRKCGCEIFLDGCKYFIYINKKGERYSDEPGDVFYINGKDLFMDSVVKNKSEVIHYIPHW